MREGNRVNLIGFNRLDQEANSEFVHMSREMKRFWLQWEMLVLASLCTLNV